MCEKFVNLLILCFQIMLSITLIILASQENLSTHFKAEYIHFHMNGVSAGIDSILEHNNNKKHIVYSSLGHPVNYMEEPISE